MSLCSRSDRFVRAVIDSYRAFVCSFVCSFACSFVCPVVCCAVCPSVVRVFVRGFARLSLVFVTHGFFDYANGVMLVFGCFWLACNNSANPPGGNQVDGLPPALSFGPGIASPAIMWTE